MENFYIRMQKRNPLGLCAFYPIDIRKIELIEVNNKIFFIKREKLLDLPHFFKSSCLHCVSMFIYGKYEKYIPHCSERHHEIKLHEDALFYSVFFKKNIKKHYMSFDLLALSVFPTKNEIINNSSSKFDENSEVLNLKPIELKTHITSAKNGTNDIIKNLIISPHPLNSAFSKGKLHNFIVDIRNSDGYVCAESVRDNKKDLKEKEKVLAMWQKQEKQKKL